MAGSTQSNIMLAIEASELFQKITGAPLTAWVGSSGMKPGTFAWSTNANDYETMASRNQLLMASAEWADLEARASANIVERWEDTLSEILVMPSSLSATASPGAVLMSTNVKPRNDADLAQVMTWATKMVDVSGRVSGASSSLMQVGFGPEWGSLSFNSLFADNAAYDAGSATARSSEEYMTTFMEGRNHFDLSSTTRTLASKIS